MNRGECSGVLLELSAQAPCDTLPTSIKERLEARRRPLVTLDAIHARLQRAARKRQEAQARQQQARARKVPTPPDSQEERAQRAARELQDRLDAAEAVRAAAAAARQRRAAAAARRAAEVRAAVEARAAEEAQQREAALKARLSRAAATRWASLAAKVSSQPESPAQFLQQHAAERAARRRDAAAVQLQRFWRGVVAAAASTRQLAAAFAATGLPQGCSEAAADAAAWAEAPQQAVRTISQRQTIGFTAFNIERDDEAGEEADPFEALAALLRAPATLAAAGGLLRRLEARRAASAASNIHKRRRRAPAEASSGSSDGEAMLVASKGRDAAVAAAQAALFPKSHRAGRSIPRYAPRVFLASYMIREHPMTVFNTWAARERGLSAAAHALSSATAALLARLTAGPAAEGSDGGCGGGGGGGGGGMPEALAAFDGAWAEYLALFAAWKRHDAAALEADLVGMAAALQRSMLYKVLPLGGIESPRVAASEDLQAVVAQVRGDAALLRSRVVQLRGAAGGARFDAALAAVTAEEAAAFGDVPAAVQGPSTPPRPAPLPPNLRGRPPTPRPGPGAESAPRLQRRAIHPAQAQRDAMLWELLHDAHWQLPTAEAELKWSDAAGWTTVMTERPPTAEELAADPAAAAAAVHRRIRRIADQAFWDARAQALAAEGKQEAAEAAAGVVTLLADLGGQLAEALPQDGGPVAKSVADVLGADALRRRLGGGLQLDGPQGARALLGVLQESAALLSALGAPARVNDAAAARAAVEADLAAAAGDRVATAAVATRAVRLLAAQLGLLRADAANAHLRMLSASLAGSEGIRHVRARFLAAHGLPENAVAVMPAALVRALPGTAAWLAAARRQRLPAAEAAAASAASAIPASSGASAASGVRRLPDARMRTGHAGAAAQHPANPADLRTPAPAAALEAPVAPASWRGAVRCGLVALVAGEVPLARGGDALPEALAADARRLAEAQGCFQRLLVGVAAALLLRQHATATRISLPAGALEAGRARLAALLADPATQLGHIAAELAAATGAGGDGAAEEALGRGLRRLLARDSPGFKAISGGLCAALGLQLLQGGGGDSSGAAAAALARCGASAFAQEVEGLAIQLRAVAAIAEAVHGEVFAALFGGA